jgi:hypothetical protein
LKAKEFPGKSEMIAKISEFKGGKSFQECCKAASLESPHLLLAVNHGDSWNNNMLFRRDPESKELNHFVLVDYQVRIIDVWSYVCD